jgi:gliding motility-associatede transport system auxiliary component
MKPLSRKSYGLAAIVLAAAVFFGLNIAVDATITNARLDLTENGRFTLSQGTKDIIRNLREPITLRLYYSKQAAAEYAQTRSYAGRVRDLLREYASRSGGKIIFEEVDPQPYTPAEDDATAAGITAIPTDSGDTVYFGLVGTNRIDGREVIPYFSPDREGLLEYDISSLVYRLSSPKKDKVAVISTLPLETGPGGMQALMAGRSRPFAIYQEVAQSYDTQVLPPDFKSIPAGTDVLMIVQPGDLSDAQTYAIDQYVLKGGRALVFVDPNSELAQQSAGGDAMMAPASSSLPRLFQSWGIAFDTNKEIGDLKLAQRVQLSRDGPPMSFPIWLHLTRDEFSDSDPVTANLQVLNLASVGSLRPLKSATTKFTSLIGSSNQAALLDVAQTRAMTMSNPQDIESTIAPSGQEYIIAARLTGPAKTAYPGGPPAGVTAPQVTSAKNINLIVMADTDIFDDRFWVHLDQMFGKTVAAPFANNDAFVMNAIENLSGSSDLISLRTRATDDRPFTLVRALQADAERQFKQQEDALKARLSDTEQQLKNLQTGQAGGSSVGITPKQEAAINQFKRQLAEIRTQLREVQRNLRQDVDALGDALAFVNIALVPILVAIFAVVLAWLRRRRRARAIPL